MSIKQKILLDLLITPGTVLPGLAGLTLLMGGWAVGAPTASFVGVIGCLIAAGVGLWRGVFHLNEITDSASKAYQTKELLQEEAELDALDRKLVRNKDPRDQSHLRNLRTVYQGFVEDLNDDKLSSYITSSMIDEVQQMFQKYVGLLEYSFEIWERSRGMDGDLKKTVLGQREDILNQIENNIHEFSDVVTRLRALSFKDGKSEVLETQGRLARSLEIAERTQEQMEKLRSGDNMDRFAEFTQEVQ